MAAPAQQKTPVDRSSNHNGTGVFKRGLHPKLDRHFDLLAMRAKMGKSMPPEAREELRKLTEELRNQ